MANLQNHNRAAISRIAREHDRTASSYKNFVDTQRTRQNYTYGVGNAKQVCEAIDQRCAEIMSNRKMQTQTNVASEWLITYPAVECDQQKYKTGDLRKDGSPVTRPYNRPRNPAQCRAFFDEIWTFCQERYGKENCIAGFVHLDESTPHLHLILVPEATSRKTGNRTVSSASLMTRNELRDFHRDLDKHMRERFGEKAAGWILNGRTKGGYTLDELKTRSRDEARMRARKGAISAREQALDKRDKELEARSQGLTEARLELDEKMPTVARREKALQEKETALSKREEDLQKREAMLARREAETERFIALGRQAAAVQISEGISADRRRGYEPWLEN